MNAITFKRLFRRSDVLLSNCARPICKKTQILRRLCATGAGVLALVGVLGFTTATQPAIPYASPSFIEAQEAHQGKPAPIHTQLFTDEVKNSDAEPIDANEIAWIEVDEYTAEALLSAGVMEFIEIDEHDQAIYAMTSGVNVVIVVVQGTVGGPVVAPKPPGIAPPLTPCPPGTVAGPGGTCIGPSWQVYDYPPTWVKIPCTTTFGSVTCWYKFEFEFIRLTAAKNCDGWLSSPCTAPAVCVEFVTYKANCSPSYNYPPSPLPSNCATPCACCPPAPLPTGVGGCTAPTFPPITPGILPGVPLPGFTMERDFKCYTPGAPW